MAAALGLAERGRGRTCPNPPVGCVLVKDGRVVGRGWTQPGGRPHAEAIALDQAREAARGATAYVTLEPCAHASPRGPACAGLLAEAGVARVVAALRDPDPRTDGTGLARLQAAGVTVTAGISASAARRSMTGWLTRRTLGRPLVTLKLAMSLDGCIALASGESRWITGPEARAHAHVERTRHEAILVGRGTWAADRPTLDVRLPGLEERSPQRVVLSSRHPRESGDDDVLWLDAPEQVATLAADHLLIEGGAQTAAAFLKAGLVDRLLLYRAPILIGGGMPAIAALDMTALTQAHGRWHLYDARQLGADRLEVYERTALSGEVRTTFPPG
ncbi:bifunctional diaminohydroxyphosphoribosylaminopyrimidine deaminase/5-amino-6-(5-phosphoribosylamino)uracil reductase RibD [Sphingomonas sp.]|uniref:bifunctional diaminohydroxyphosphoribosylaminopyrimidine deaminase/5-amino-6-(5-phosphoribosylamino)uracil reductase RibD n=1 Tax=Sphingomonas sp. TaxID=28214 RepID=UPI003CC5CD33